MKASHILPHNSAFSLSDLLIDISNLHCDRSRHPNLHVFLLCSLPHLRNCAKRGFLG